MKLKIYFFGKANEVTTWEEKYLKRIGFRAKVEIIALPQAGITDVKKAKVKEGELFLNKISDQSFVVALDENGAQYDSVKFAGWLKNKFVAFNEVHLVIGGAHGLAPVVLARANARISLGNMVWTRNLVRLMLLEQLYRALEIDAGGNFHKV